MTWKKIIENGNTIWECSEYSDLGVNELDNLAKYGQPNSPYLSGFDHKHIPDFKNIIVRMMQLEVMTNGYGKLIRPKHFPVIKKLLNCINIIRDIRTIGSRHFEKFSFDDLLAKRVVNKFDRIIYTNLYVGNQSVPTVSGKGVTPEAAAYIHGSVGFALMSNTSFTITSSGLVVNAEIGALDDNWDFKSGNRIAKILNPLVETLYGPEVNNLESMNSSKGKIVIEFRGPGRRFLTDEIITSHRGSPRGLAKNLISRTRFRRIF